MMRHLLLLSALAGLTACQGSVEQIACDAPKDAGVFEIGTGEECFSRLAANDEIPLINGPQGGYHVWLAVGCKDCGEGSVELRYGVRDPATQMPLAGTGELQEVVPLAGEGFRQAAGIIVYMPGLSWDPEIDPPPAKGTHVVLWVEASSGGQLLHSAEVEVVIGDVQHWDPCEDDPDSESCSFN